MSIQLLRGPVCGVLLFSAMTIALAYLTGEGILPMEAAGKLLYGVLVLSSLLAGAVCGGAGKRGMLTGVILSFCCLLAKAVSESGDLFSVFTMMDLLCILPSAWIGSCIFHKKRSANTKRNHQIRRRNYK